jgi:hypothetical protein
MLKIRGKEDVYNHIKLQKVPYTIVDVGWWYQIAYPNVPAGKLSYAKLTPDWPIPGDG